MDFSVKYDIAVVGGGIAGVAAALQSARMGQKTVLIEKNILLGGLATSGLVYIYLPLCDGNGHQACFGITEELLKNSLELGPGRIPEWQKSHGAPESGRYCCRFSPASYMLSLEKLLLDSGVELWLDTLVCSTEVTNDRMTAVIVQNESGQGRIEADYFIDGSGSAILARRAGLPCAFEDNYLTMWAVEYAQDCQRDLGDNVHVITYIGAGLNDDHPVLLDKRLREKIYPGLSDDEVREKVTYHGISGKMLSQFVVDSHELLRTRYQLLREHGKSRSEAFALKLPLMPQLRKICCLQTEYMLQTGENNKYFADSIGLAPDWRKAGPVWEIPYRSLYSRQMSNLLMAGRCTGAQGDAWEITRVIPTAGLTGQVAGLAAVMAKKQHQAVGDLAVSEIQNNLRDLGFKLHLPEIGL